MDGETGEADPRGGGVKPVPASQAKVGDVVLDQGEAFEIVSIIGAHELIAGISEQHRLDRTPHFWVNSSAATCCLRGETSGREKRNQERAKAKVAKQLRRSA